VPQVRDGSRYWIATRLIEVDDQRYYLYTETTLAHIDALFAQRIMHAYLWLFGILIVVLLLVVRHVRLVDYAYLYQETKRANEMKDLFTNMIAHELRAPLTAMRGYASFIEEDQHATDTQKSYAAKIGGAAERLILIVNDLLDVARLQSGKLAVRNERFESKSAVASVIDAMQPIAREKKIAITMETASSTVYLTGDEKRFIQALTNLVSNALKYTKSGAITVSLEDRGDRAEIRVKDTGIGMSAENQKQLFAPFFRVEGTDTAGITGTGLGMWITKQLIELMQGSIAVESIKGIGTHVVVTLPKGS
jgi:signal transduction histidine kinase